MLLPVRIIALRTLKTYAALLHGHKDHAAVESALDNWYALVSKTEWNTSADVKLQFTTASIITASRIVFNVKGNDYRLIIEVNYKKKLVWIIWFGNHKDYDKIDAKEVEYDG